MQVTEEDETGRHNFKLDGIMTRAMVPYILQPPIAAVSSRMQVNVHELCPLSTAYQLFSTMGLRHLVQLPLSIGRC